ncbi:MAG TPA: class III extradiol ring-cleavage dioxygenase [Candidatus Acidoferrum sp.]|nr:class III extradiol ring-cleavage dioxygenase [Candidatus Acidoferrum sp.]
MTSNDRLPTYFIPHGGGPWPFIDWPADQQPDLDVLAAFLRNLTRDLGTTPRAILVISGHWEAAEPTVMAGATTSMLYDYGGFPAHTYELRYPAPGSPALAERVVELLSASGFPTAVDRERGLDHGTFIPLMLVAPNADIPVVQLSLVDGLDPALHLALGRALAPLRDEGVLIVGSGMSYHNMREFFSPNPPRGARRFDDWLTETVTAEPAARAARLHAWSEADDARLAHPREEHLLPLMVAAGAAENDAGRRVFHGRIFGAEISGYRFG